MRFRYLKSKAFDFPDGNQQTKTCTSYRGYKINVTIREVSDWRQTNGHYSEFQISYQCSAATPVNPDGTDKRVSVSVRYDLENRAYEKSLRSVFESHTDKLIADGYSDWLKGQQGQLNF